MKNTQLQARRTIMDVINALEEVGPIRQFFQKWVSEIKAGPKPKHHAMRMRDFLDAMEADGGATNVPEIRAEIIRKMGAGFLETLVWLKDAQYALDDDTKNALREKIVQASGNPAMFEITIEFTPLTLVNTNDN